MTTKPRWPVLTILMCLFAAVVIAEEGAGEAPPAEAGEVGGLFGIFVREKPAAEDTEDEPEPTPSEEEALPEPTSTEPPPTPEPTATEEGEALPEPTSKEPPPTPISEPEETPPAEEPPPPEPTPTESVPVLGEERATSAEEPKASPVEETPEPEAEAPPSEVAPPETAEEAHEPVPVPPEAAVAEPTPGLERDLEAARLPPTEDPGGTDVRLPTEEIHGELEKPDIFFLLPKARSRSDEQLIRARIRREITRPLIKDWLEEELLLK